MKQVLKMIGSQILMSIVKMSKEEVIELKRKLNLLYDEVDRIDAQIDVLVVKRKSILAKIESGAAIILKYGEEETLVQLYILNRITKDY